MRGNLSSCRFHLTESLKIEHGEVSGCEIEIFWQVSWKNGPYIVLKSVENETFNSGRNKDCSELTDLDFI